LPMRMLRSWWPWGHGRRGRATRPHAVVAAEAARPAQDDGGVVVVLVDMVATEDADDAGGAIGIWRGEEEPWERVAPLGVGTP
jgi:hypothetical protein